MLAIDLFLSSFVSLQLSFVTNNHGYYLTLLLKKGIIIMYANGIYTSHRQTKQNKTPRLSIYYVRINPLFIPCNSRQRWMLSPPIIKEPIIIVIYSLMAREEHIVG